MTDRFDYIVIGAGSAGSVVAGRLSEAGQGTVCVLEAGPPDRSPYIHVPAAVVHLLDNPRLNWMYQTAPSWGTAGRSLVQSRGKTLGGSGAINGHVYTRGHRTDFDTWAALGNRGWSYAEVLPYFKRCERRIGDGDDRYRGRSGPFTITDIDQADPLCDAFMDGAESLGIPRNPDYNGASQEGVAYVQRSIHRGRRVSPARAFLYPAMKRGNTEVRTRARVLQIVFAGKRAIGVRYRRGGRDEVVLANREVILCGGAIASPHLLQLSGLGAPARLQALGVPLVHALPGVGENLRDHYAARLVMRIRGIETINERVRGLGLVKEVARYAFTRRGALALTPTLVYCFGKSDETLEVGDIQVSFTPASYPAGIWSGLDRFPGATIACWQQRPASRGHVRALSADPLAAPELQPNYLAEEEDRQAILAAMRLGRRLAASLPFAHHVEREIWPGDPVQSDAELLDHARRTGNTTYHPIGTCRMGPAERADSVVDDHLRVHGMQGLRVADASIMPTMPAANTNAATLMIGEKAADLILGRRPLPPELAGAPQEPS
ncbi:GMC family oxidoreductase [Halomonas kalidii]|uniref:GMC family oxidoreductase N-terminal domain-containing protein n=1 Tax=Halomonas kalidii TaxID=3043293 RepID=A0ABT6VP63_9GAMM|nr:GMC family oxidoreductase N-terminal domain-containing protein [Halomonas kalidii]MDI5935780.1 GMC family oxidoreductase N-terminal domain-containing protein [Halomonas kalidii]